MEAWLITFGTTHSYLIYALITLVGILEGPILSVLLGIILRLGYFSLVPVYIALMLGDLIGDVAWYHIGYHYGHRAIKKFGARFGITEAGVLRMEKLFHENKHKILFISKITNGFGLSIVTLTTAGIVRIPFLRYMTINIIGQLIWSGMLLGIGYFFSDSYMRIHSVAGKISFILGIVVAAVLAFLWVRQARKSKS